jgi:hypothetical protein
MGFFGPSREERYAQIAQTLSPYGFSLQPERGAAAVLQGFTPFELFRAPESYSSVVAGQIDGRAVAVAQYEYTSTDNEGNTSTISEHITVVHDHNIRGVAGLATDWTKTAVGAFINAALWIPPFTIVKAIQLLFDSKHPDREVGQADFDTRYKIRAVNDEVARTVFHPAFQQALLRCSFDGTLEVRHGALLYTLSGSTFDAPGLMRTLGHVPILLAGALNQVTHYR